AADDDDTRAAGGRRAGEAAGARRREYLLRELFRLARRQRPLRLRSARAAPGSPDHRQAVGRWRRPRTRRPVPERDRLAYAPTRGVGGAGGLMANSRAGRPEWGADRRRSRPASSAARRVSRTRDACARPDGIARRREGLPRRGPRDTAPRIVRAARR